MGRRRPEHEERAEAGARRRTCAAADRLEKSTAAHNGGRCFSVKDRAVYFPISAPARSRLGFEEILRDLVAGFGRTK